MPVRECASSAMIRAIIVAPRSIERMRQPMADDGGEAGKAEDDFVDAFGGRVACEGRPHVGVEQRAHGGKRGGEILHDVRGAARRINAAVAFPFLGERKLELDLPGERAQGALERADDERVEIGRAGGRPGRSDADRGR